MARVPVFSRHKQTASPCYGGGKGCEKRKVGCHSVCDRYKKWQSQELAKKDEAYRLYKTNRVTEDYVVGRIREAKKKMRRS